MAVVAGTMHDADALQWSRRGRTEAEPRPRGNGASSIADPHRNLHALAPGAIKAMVALEQSFADSGLD